ncbi:hypothetical protein [Geothrix sp.]|jgi:hypothetical protein|uniref:hypothetical protein n=1 Tax=Geothrix sp. TaxID=1962974 RepID=UPI0025B88B63|nr:hypothetical protein [Geothrix sp.]
MKPLAAALLATTLALPAQEAATLGVRVHALVPMGDLRDLTNSQAGLGVAAYIDIPINQGFVLRPLLGAQFIPKGDTLGLTGTKTSVTSVDLMAEFLWFPGEDPERGPYLIGALGGQQWRLSATGTSPSTASHTRLGASGGLGFQASSHFGLEVRGFWSPIERDLTATGLTVGATWRF